MKLHTCLIVALSVIGLSWGWSQSAWVPEKGKVTLSPIYSFENAGNFYNGNTNSGIFGNRVEINTATLLTEYGLTDRWALDLSLGYVSSTLKNNNLGALQNNQKTLDGLADTTLGLRYKVLDEVKANNLWTPTFTLRAAGIIEGTYRADLIQSPGNGASGGQIGFLFGKSYEWAGGIGYYGGMSYRHLGESVPDALLSSFGIYKTIYKGFSCNVGYRDDRSLAGKSVGEAKLPDDFQQLKDIRSSIEGGVSYQDSGNRIYGVTISKMVSGENTFDRSAISTYASFQF